MAHEIEGNGPHDTVEEKAIDWYKHYMAIDAAELATAYALKSASDESDITPAMQMAMEQREEEIGRKLAKGDL